MALSGSSVFVLPRFNLCTHDCGGSLPAEVEQSPNTVLESTGEATLTEISHFMFAVNDTQRLSPCSSE